MLQQVLQERQLVGELAEVKERMQVSQLGEEPLPHLHLSVVRTLELRVLKERVHSHP
jgi:hypothetical protein